MKHGATLPLTHIALLLKHDVGSLHPRAAGGTEQVFLEDVRLLRSKGYAVSAFARFAMSKPRVRKLPYAAFLVGMGRILTAASWPRLNRVRIAVRHFIRISADLYYLYGFTRQVRTGPVVGYSTLLLPLLRRRAIILVHDMHNLVLPGVFAARYRQSTYLFCSRYLLNAYRRAYPGIFDAGNSDVLYNALPAAFYRKPVTVPPREGRAVRFLYCGAWAEEKGMDILLSAFRSVADRSGVSLTIASHPRMWRLDYPGEQTAFIRTMRSRIASLPSVTVLGGVRRSDMPAVYRKHDYTIVPSVWEEPFGMVALESIACGTPVIAFDSGGIGEIISRENGLRIPKGGDGLSRILQEIAGGRAGIPKPVRLTAKNAEMKPGYRIPRLEYFLRNAASV